MTKPTRTLFAIVLMTTSVFFAQRKERQEKIKLLKVAFITERLTLSTEEAQVFWPVYNAHEEEMETLRARERKEVRSKLRNMDELTESQADKLLPLAIALEKDKTQLKVDFIKELSAIISAKKTILLMKTEEDFKRQLIKQYGHKKRGGR